MAIGEAGAFEDTFQKNSKFRNIIRMERLNFSISFPAKQSKRAPLTVQKFLNLHWKHFRNCILAEKFHHEAPRFIASTCESSLLIRKAAAHKLQSHRYSRVQAQTNGSKRQGEQDNSYNN